MSSPERPEQPFPDAQAVAILRHCRGLVAAVDASGQGISYQPSPTELTLLQGFAEVVNAAAARPDGEGWFDEIRHRAGLTPSSAGLLSGVLRTYYARHISPEAQVEQLKRSLARRWARTESD